MISWLFGRRRLLTDRELLGRWGEKRCERFLKGKCLRRLALNFFCKSSEIDLVVMVDTDGSIVFVEIKNKSC